MKSRPKDKPWRRYPRSSAASPCSWSSYRRRTFPQLRSLWLA